MTSGAALLRFDVVMLLQKLTEIFLVRDAIALGILHHVILEILLGVVVEVVDLLERTKVLLRLAVTIEAEAHGVTLSMIDRLHFVHVTVAALTGNAAVDVSGVVEIDIVWSAVNPNPLDRLAFDLLPIFIQNRLVIDVDPHRITKWSQLGIPLLHVLVAVPTSIGTRNIGVARMLHKTVAIPTIEPELIHMEVVIVRNRLRRLITNTLRLRSRIIPEARHHRRA